jgi:hypothetical protein
MMISGSKPETALFSDAHPLSVAGKGTIIESSTECCSLNKCNSFIIETLFSLGRYFSCSLVWLDIEHSLSLCM